MSTEELKQIYLHGFKLERYQLIQIENHSSLKPLVKIIGSVIRFCNNKKKKCNKEKLVFIKWLTINEMHEANLYLMKQAQWECLHDELLYLEAGNEVPRTSNILKLCPMVDKISLIRIDGRLRGNENVSYETANPIILDKNHHFTKLFILEYHQFFAYQNFETVVNEIRKRYCIPRMRTTMKKFIVKCQDCRNKKAMPMPPQMGRMQSARTDIRATPFSQTGEDLSHYKMSLFHYRFAEKVSLNFSNFVREY